MTQLDITKESVNKTTRDLEVLQTIIENIDTTYAKLVSKKITEEEMQLSTDPKIYFIDPSILVEINAIFVTKKTMRIDSLVALYRDWMTKALSVLMLNLSHYHKNKKIQAHVDEILNLLIPNSKNINAKAIDYLSKANVYLKHIDQPSPE